MRNATLLCLFGLTAAALAAPKETHWVLRAPTVKPAAAPAGWSYDATSKTVRHTLAEGREQELGWTPLPEDIAPEGFFITVLARATSTKGTRTIATVAISPAGFRYDKTPGALSVEAVSVDGQPAEVSKTVELKPLPGASHLTVKIDSGDEVRHTYTYVRK